MKKLLALLVYLPILFAEPLTDSANSSEIGFICKPEARIGSDILIKYNGKYVSTFHDKIHLRPEGWVISELNSSTFEDSFEQYLNNNNSATEWLIPLDRHSYWQEKKHIHKIDELKIDENGQPDFKKWKTEITTVYKYEDAPEMKRIHFCALADIESLNNFVAERKKNILGFSDDSPLTQETITSEKTKEGLAVDEDLNIFECRADENNSAQYCVEKYELNTIDDCIENVMSGNMTADESRSFCKQLSIEFDFEAYLDDRPTEFYDMLGKESIGSIRSYACKVPRDEEGNELNNAVITYYEDDDTVIEKTELPYKAIIHILDEKNYAEINYGSTIFPIAENRFFTNYLQDDDRILAGTLDIDNPNPEIKGGTDKGPEGGGWIISKENNQLNIFVGAYEIEFNAECYWNDIDTDDLE
jgi:hypothetical protein